MTDIEKMLTDIRFYGQVLGDAQRTILCPPALVEQVQAVVDRYEAGGRYRVAASLACPTDRLLVLDEVGVEAARREAAQRSLRGLWR